MLSLLLAAGGLGAQTPPQFPPGTLSQLQVAQPAVDLTSPVTASAEFDPPVVGAGKKTFYRVTLDATESSFAWPAKIPVPAGLQFGVPAHGQLTQMQGPKYRPLTAFAYEVQTTATGHFTVPGFSVDVAGQTVAIPAAELEVVAVNSNLPPARRLVLETSATNLFPGQPFLIRVLLPAGPSNEIEVLREIQLSGNGLMIDKTASRQAIEATSINGQLRQAYISELRVTPLTAGPLTIAAQGFTAGREITGPISIRGQVSIPGGPARYVLLTSDPVSIQVRPLPVESEPRGFTGAIGRFYCDPPNLSADRMRVGEPVQLKLTFHGEGELAKLVPPVAPRSREWQIIADPPPATSFTLIPLTDEVRTTPAIPFSYFDPLTAKYVDLTTPPIPVTVVGDGLPVQLPAADEGAATTAPLKLSGLAPGPGKTAVSLKPLQLHGWFVAVQLVPVIGFLALWRWDRRRRFLEAHPDLVRRRQARRALRREKRHLQRAVAGGDTAAFQQHAAAALRIAVAPHYPANPQALVGGDVLQQLTETERNGEPGEIVRHIFAAADRQFALTAPAPTDWLALHDRVLALLCRLEAKL